MIELEGVVTEALPNTTFNVDIGNGHIILAHISLLQLLNSGMGKPIGKHIHVACFFCLGPGAFAPLAVCQQQALSLLVYAHHT